jgi:hypothetical protein
MTDKINVSLFHLIDKTSINVADVIKILRFKYKYALIPYLCLNLNQGTNQDKSPATIIPWSTVLLEKLTVV